MIPPAATAHTMLAKTSLLFEELESVEQTCGFRPEFLFGSLANDMKRVQRTIEERSRQISGSAEQQEDESEGSERFEPGDIFAMIDNLYEHAHGPHSSVVREGFVASLKRFEDTLLNVSAARTYLKAASDPPGTMPQLEKHGLVTQEHIAMIRSCLKQLQAAESSRPLGHEASAFAHLLDFRLRNALAIGERAKDMPSARDLNAAWCHRTLQRLQRQDDGSAKRPEQARLLRWAREPRLVHQNLRQLVKPWTHKAGTKPHRPVGPGPVEPRFRRIPSAPTKRSPTDRITLGVAAAEAWTSCVDRNEFSQHVSAKVSDASM